MSEMYVLRVNGTDHAVSDAWLGESLLYVLRERLGFPGAKAGCEQGECGSCSVLVDGTLVCACLVLAAAAVDAEIVTVEGLQPHDRGEMSDVQRAFVETGAVQCGFCTPGLVMAVHALLEHDPDPTDLAVREAISGNLCRCTGYGRILEAVEVAANARRGPTP
jgi:carbon-monoxide dehydrogenase small subunit